MFDRKKTEDAAAKLPANLARAVKKTNKQAALKKKGDGNGKPKQ